MTDKDKRFRFPWSASRRGSEPGAEGKAAPSSHAGPERLDPGWRGVVMICSECEGRDDGPHGLRAKEVRKLLKLQPRDGAGKLKIISSDCLGPCPKKAMTMVVAAGTGSLEVYGLRHSEDAIDGVQRAMGASR